VRGQLVRGYLEQEGPHRIAAALARHPAKPPYKDVNCRVPRARDRTDSGESKALPSKDADDFVSIEGVVHHVTSLGIFLDIHGRRVFVGQNCMEPLEQPPKPGETVTLRVPRWFARQEGLV
jgi:hypothetical protein